MELSPSSASKPVRDNGLNLSSCETNASPESLEGVWAGMCLSRLLEKETKRLQDKGMYQSLHSNEPIPSHRFTIRNLETGLELDLRDEAKSDFGIRFAGLIGAWEDSGTYRRFLYLLYSAERRDLLSLFWKACSLGDVETATDFLYQKGVNPMAKGVYGWTALHIAAETGFVEICRVILDIGQGVDVNARTRDGQTPLHLAAKNGHIGVVELFLSYPEVDLHAKDVFGCTVLHYALSRGHLKLAKKLVTSNTSLLHITDLKGRLPSDMLSHCSGDMDSITTLGKYQRNRFNGVVLRTAREDRVEQLLRRQLPVPFPCLSDSRVDPTLTEFIPIQLLGQGSFGEVYLAKHAESGQFYALKTMKKRFLSKNHILKYALTERNVLTYVRHPFIEQLHAAFQTPSRLILVLEYCPGGDLRSLLSTYKRFPENLARIYAAEVLLAIDYMHRNEVIYRDLKLENVALDERGHVRVLDFGLAKEGIGRDKTTSSFCGSIGYLAPEMISQKQYGNMVDWYMFGCFVYEMITGRPPFFAVEIDDMMALIEEGHLKFPKDISSEAKDLIQSLMLVNPKKRLGAGKLGFATLKSHPFFSRINWQEVLEYKLPTPTPVPRPKTEERINRSKVYGSMEENDRLKRVFGWSFASENC